MQEDPVPVQAVEVLRRPGLHIAEYFGAAATGDARLSACFATVDGPAGEAKQTPEFDQYVLVVSGKLTVTQGTKPQVLEEGQGLILVAGRRARWAWREPCRYVIICIPALQRWPDEPGAYSAPARPPDRPSYELAAGRCKAGKGVLAQPPPLLRACAPEGSLLPERKCPPHPRRRCFSPLTRRGSKPAGCLTGQSTPNLPRSPPSEAPSRPASTPETATAVRPPETVRLPNSPVPVVSAPKPPEAGASAAEPSSSSRAGALQGHHHWRGANVGTMSPPPPPLHEPAPAAPPTPAHKPAVSPQAASSLEPGPSSRRPGPTAGPSSSSEAAASASSAQAAAGQEPAASPAKRVPRLPEEQRALKASTRHPSTQSMAQAASEFTATTMDPRTGIATDNNGSESPRTTQLSDGDDKSDRVPVSSFESEERPARYGARHLSTPIVVVASELHPWSKTGGLAMVTSAYGYEFAVRGHRTMVVTPRYGEYDRCQFVGHAKIWLDGQQHLVRFYHQRKDFGAGKACDYVFVDHHSYRREGIYGDPARGGEYEDNLFRYALLCVAAAEAPLILDLGGSPYGQDVCFVANDWQAGLLPLYLLYKYKRNRTYRRARCLLVLHNLGYQGRFRRSRHPVDKFLGLPAEAGNELQGEDVSLGSDCLNVLAAGIKCADRVLTVSPTYAHEIQTPEGGFGLYQLVKEKAAAMRVAGILNGISDEWCPMTDPHIARRFGLADFREGKQACKAALQREMGLRLDPDVAVLGFCGRLCHQKGVHLITSVIPWLLQDLGNGVNGRVQLVLMGKGDPTLERQLQAAEAANPGRVCGYVGFSPSVEHKMMAGCDLLLMPSQYEPCGLPQMYAQQYGTLVVAHLTGGLRDTVTDARDEERGTGFLFKGFHTNSFKERLYTALEAFFKKRTQFAQMQANAMLRSFYWPSAIDEYERHLDYTMEDCPARV